MQRQHAALLELARSWRRYEADLELVTRAVTETAVTAVDVERASVWLWDDAHTKIVCRDLFERTNATHSKGTELSAGDFPNYFEALESEEVIAASDAHRDPRTQEFSTSYLTPLGIGAMLDAPIRVAGTSVGVLCHEHVGASREFAIDEQNVAAYLASLVSLALESQRRRETEADLAESLSLLRATFEATAEGILAVDSEASVVTHNQRFIQIWGIPIELLGKAGDGGPRLRFLADQTVDPDAFVARARTVFSDSDSESVDLIELRDGRSLERTSRPQWLNGKTIGRVWSYRDVTHLKRTEAALRESEARLRDLASRDALTGLFNRRMLVERLEEEMRRSRRSQRPFSIAMLDLDHFKRVNDELGHQTGDEVLKAFSEDLTQRLRKTDFVGRWGGEEFLVILPETNETTARQLLDEVRKHVGRERDGLPTFTVSVGLAEYPTRASEVTPLVAAADARLYEAKRAGRNSVR